MRRRICSLVTLSATALATACGDATKPTSLDLSAIAFAYASDSSNRNLDIFVMPPDGSDVRRVVTSDDVEAYPDWSPDGQTLLFTRMSAATRKSSLWTVRADGSDLREVTAGSPESFGGRWSPDGQSIVFRTPGTPSYLGVVRADGSGWRTIAAGVVTDAYTVPDWAPDGRITFSRYDDRGSRGIWAIDPDGSGLAQLTTLEDGEPRWSPDGKRLVVTTQLYFGVDVKNSLFVLNADGSGRRQITGGEVDRSPEWSPDGQSIIFDRMLPPPLGGGKSICAMYQVPATGGVPVNIQPARTRLACLGSAWRSTSAR